MKRSLFIVGNWKMNTTLQSAKSLAADVVKGLDGKLSGVEVGVCPPAPFLLPVAEALRGSQVVLGAQNASNEKPGAFTGEVAIEMLLDVGCQWVILGHSERRQFFGDTDEIINKKVLAALDRGLKVIFCIGELLDDRQSGRTEAVLEVQLAKGLLNLTAAQMERVVIAYEPVWAIGTGVTASPEQAEETHAYIRKWLTTRFSSSVSDATRIQYGGSVKGDNAKELLAKPNIDGALVGGASLKADQFLAIVRAASEVATIS
ncbi:triose-phosphate isomerase [Schlesneria paludicola]|uniref:triose-phosphate isomerase n=1 Tax=Schlesneria paludicola TaxID=360056 RepID=UPI000A010AA5